MTCVGDQQRFFLEDLFLNDKKVWERFVKENSPVIWSAVVRTFRQYGFPYRTEDAEDVYCSVFLSLLEDNYKKLKKFTVARECSLATFLTVITVRKTIDYLRKEKNRFLGNGTDDDLFEAIPDTRPGAVELLEKEQRQALLCHALERLSARERELYQLLFENERSAEEIAGLLNVSISAVYLKKNRLVEKIKKHLKEIERTYV